MEFWQVGISAVLVFCAVNLNFEVFLHQHHQLLEAWTLVFVLLQHHVDQGDQSLIGAHFSQFLVRSGIVRPEASDGLEQGHTKAVDIIFEGIRLDF